MNAWCVCVYGGWVGGGVYMHGVCLYVVCVGGNVYT